MARTKQTARKSSGGKAPKKQLAANSSGALKNYFTSQQKSGDNTKAVFINSENTFRDFSFPRTDESVDNDEFRPLATMGRCSGLENGFHQKSDLYMRYDMASCFDGAGIGKRKYVLIFI